MFPKFTGPKLANHCYKMNARTRFWDFEKLEDSVLFFANPTLSHIIVARNKVTAPILQEWGAHLARLPKRQIPYCQVRFVQWVDHPWHIISTNSDGMYDILVRFEAHDHELTSNAPQRLNSEGFLQLFPFRGTNFWTVRQPVLKLEIK